MGVRLLPSFFFFFFQAEDGIRDVAVTGVQTCALPISLPLLHRRYHFPSSDLGHTQDTPSNLVSRQGASFRNREAEFFLPHKYRAFCRLRARQKRRTERTFVEGNPPLPLELSR